MSSRTDEVAVGQLYRPLREAVCDVLREEMMSGDLPAGERLIEEQIAQRLHVSRNPVREALRMLATEGFVEVLPRRGAIVATLPDQTVEDIFDIRVALESLAGRLAAERATTETVNELRQLVDAHRAALSVGNLVEVGQLNTEFHSVIMEATGNEVLVDLMSPLRGRMQRVFREALNDERARRSLDEHDRLVEAIALSDGHLAAELGARHVEEARQRYRAGRAGSAPDLD